MAAKIVEINLFGACSVRSTGPNGFSVSGTKQKAIFALLATAPLCCRTRAFLQEALWDSACYDHGRQSLRRALADLRKVMGSAYDSVFSGNYHELRLDLAKVRFTGQPDAGEFLEGIDIREPVFQRWLNGIRQNPFQLASLYTLASMPQHSILPVVAALPLRAIGDDAGDAALGDWLAEEISRSLSRSRLLSVISHLSCRELMKGVIDVGKVRATLGADFCLAGSLRRTGDRIILDVDFIDARSGRIIWTRQHRASLTDLLGLDSEAVGVVVSAVGYAIADEAMTHVAGRELADIQDHRLLIAGVSMMHRSTLRNFARAKSLLDEAASRAPRAAEIHAWLAKWHILSVINRWSVDVARDTELARDACARALDLSPDGAFGLTIDGFVQASLVRDLDVAAARYELALARNPNESLAWLLKGALHTFRYEGDQAVDAADRAQALSPIDPFGYFYDSLIAGAYLTKGDYARALALADRSIRVNDRHLSTLRVKIFALAFLDRVDEARAVGRDLMRRSPDFTVEEYMRHHPCSTFEMGRMVESALRMAGIS